jgi:hypothetical protein
MTIMSEVWRCTPKELITYIVDFVEDDALRWSLTQQTKWSKVWEVI